MLDIGGNDNATEVLFRIVYGIEPQRNDIDSKRATGSRWQTIVKSVGENSYEEKKVFKFKEMDAKSWREFKDVCGTDFDGFSYSFSDGICWEEFYLLPNTIGINMFADCSSLKVLVLPESVSEIGSLAFSSCQSLHVMRIPKKTKSIGRFPFQYSSSLSKLFIPRGIHYKTPDEVYRNCSPGLQVYDY